MANCKNKNVEQEKKDKIHCKAFCPKCGADLYYLDDECICKNKECSWTCGGCEKK